MLQAQAKKWTNYWFITLCLTGSRCFLLQMSTGVMWPIYIHRFIKRSDDFFGYLFISILRNGGYFSLKNGDYFSSFPCIFLLSIYIYIIIQPAGRKQVIPWRSCVLWLRDSFEFCLNALFLLCGYLRIYTVWCTIHFWFVFASINCGVCHQSTRGMLWRV